MGLFDFVRDIGKKVFGSDEEAGEKIKAEIESANPGVSNLDVQYEPQSGTVTPVSLATWRVQMVAPVCSSSAVRMPVAPNV